MTIKFIQDVAKAIEVMRDAGKWLEESGKKPSKWWQLTNLNRKFLSQYAKPEEFYVGLINRKPAVAAILQINQNVQDWQFVDKEKPSPALYIHWLCVHRGFSGKNLSKYMMDFAAKKAKREKIKFLRVDTNAGEIKLRQIYEKLGFTLVDIIQEDYRQTVFYQRKI